MMYETISLSYNWNEDRKILGEKVMNGSTDWKVGMKNLDRLEPESIYEEALRAQVRKDILDAQAKKAAGDITGGLLDKLEKAMSKKCEECPKKDTCDKYKKRQAENSDADNGMDEKSEEPDMGELFEGFLKTIFGIDNE